MVADLDRFHERLAARALRGGRNPSGRADGTASPLRRAAAAGLLAGVLGPFAAPGPLRAAPGDCRARCAGEATEDDRATCVANCERARASRSWRKEVLGPPRPAPASSGAPDPGRAGARRPAPPPAPAADPVATCSLGCLGLRALGDRAACMAGCVRRPAKAPAPRPVRPAAPRPRPASPPATSRAPGAAPAPSDCARQRAQERARCLASCERDPGLDATDRATCRANCERADASHGWRDAVLGKGCGAARAAAPAPAPRPGAACDTTQCRADCRRRFEVCASACAEPGSDAATCRLNCEATEQRCTRKCEAACGR